MAVYPGNSALSTAVKDRVISTFQQTLALYKQGRTEEVVQGCGLILRMDPMFDPAKKLMEKARNPASPINVDALIATDPIAEARAAMQARNFQKVVDITTEILTNDLMNDEARVLNEQAREKLEAAPFVDQFVKKADQAIAAGDPNAAKASLDKIRSLDGDDTAIARIESGIKGMKPAGGSPSFVVDTPAQPSRGSAQASDFGFTFEEEKGGAPPPPQSFSFDSPFSTDTGTVPSITPPSNFSFDAPSQPAKPAPPPQQPASSGFSFDTPPPSPAFSFDTPQKNASGEFDFTTASVETSPDDQKKVQEYLAEGDKLFDGGEYQQAIDAWSRIFLIDVTNEQASERIERAKMKRRDVDQQGEALLASGIQAFDRGDRAAARETFAKLLQIDPHNPTAQEYMEKLSDIGVEGGAAGFASAYIAPKPAAAPAPVEEPWGEEPATSDASLVPPPPAPPSAARKTAGAAKPAARPEPAPSSATSGSAMRAVIAVVVLAVLAGGGWFAWKKFMAKPPANTAATESIFTSANSLAQKGQYDAAIALLQDVKPNDPQHDKALTMIADLQAKKSKASEMVNGRPADAVYQESLASAKASFDARDYDAAKKALDTAARIKPLPPDMKAMYDSATQQVSKLEGAKALFNSQKYQEALANLQSLAQTDPQNQSIRRLMNDAHFNLGAQALQEERLPDAAREFAEVLKNDPNDELAQRSKLLAERYDGQPKDLLYKIYVKYLPLRKAG
jgi:tetratricopeptide (TPR) repeat protein